MKLRVAIFASGNGSNASALMKKARELSSHVEICFVFSDQANAGVIAKAQGEGVRHFVIEKVNMTRGQHEQKILNLLLEHRVQWIFLAGYMRLLSPNFLKSFNEWQGGQQRVVNIHPSLLPAYPGVNSIERAFKDKCKETGVTLHYVDDGVDTGPIIKQAKVEIQPDENLKTLAEKMHKAEHQLYGNFLSELVQGR